MNHNSINTSAAYNILMDRLHNNRFKFLVAYALVVQAMLFVYVVQNLLPRNGYIVISVLPVLLLFPSVNIRNNLNYVKYLESYQHKYFSHARILGLTLVLFNFYMLLLYLAYITVQLDFLQILIAVICLTAFEVIITYYRGMKRLHEYFSSCYNLVNGKPFFEFKNFKQAFFVPSRFNMLQYCFYSVVALVTSKAVIWNVDIIDSFLCSGAMLWLFIALFYHGGYVMALYQHFVIQPRIERHFNQPMLSDWTGSLKQDKAMREKLFGPGPLKKRPIQYEEIFPERTSGSGCSDEIRQGKDGNNSDLSNEDSHSK